MSGIFDRRAKRFISTEQAERAVPSRTVMASRVARDDVNRSERVQKKEDNIQMDKDDFLLTQIDEFREKAKRLQEMLNTKESKAEELSNIVEERQEKADGITAQVAKQIDVLIESVHEKMAEIEVNVNMIEEISTSCAVYDKEKGKIVLYYIGELEPDKLVRILKDKLPRYMIPNKTEKLEQMPLTANGKIDRVFLMKKAQER